MEDQRMDIESRREMLGFMSKLVGPKYEVGTSFRSTNHAQLAADDVIWTEKNFGVTSPKLAFGRFFVNLIVDGQDLCVRDLTGGSKNVVDTHFNMSDPTFKEEDVREILNIAHKAQRRVDKIEKKLKSAMKHMEKKKKAKTDREKFYGSGLADMFNWLD